MAEFKHEAIKLVTEHGLTLAEASRKLDVATKSLRTWMDQQERGKLKPSLGASKLTPDQRIRELERDLAIAKMERDILKNRLRSSPHPLCIETLGRTLRYREGSACQLLGGFDPVKKHDLGEVTDLSVEAPLGDPVKEIGLLRVPVLRFIIQ